MTTRITYAPNTERKNAAKALAHSNTAIHALLDGIKDSLIGCDDNTCWPDANDAHHVASKLLEVYCFLNDKQQGDNFELPTDREGSGDEQITFNVKRI